jgi:cytochrome b
LFKNWSKSAVTVVAFWSVLIFTLTTNVVFQPATVWAADSSQRDTASETAGASLEAKDKLAGAADGATGFFSGIWGWITGVTDAVNKMWGMENGSGVAMVVNGIFYLILIVVFGFVGKMILNIFTDAVKGENSVDQRYQKPSFRKK